MFAHKSAPCSAAACTLISILFLCGCGDHSKHLPGGYLYVSEDSETQEITRAEGIRPGEDYVPCNVTAYAYDNNFIVAIQKARKACFPLAAPGDSLGLRSNPYGQRDGEIYYWIIEAKQQIVHGPLSADNFRKKYSELGVSVKLDMQQH